LYESVYVAFGSAATGVFLAAARRCLGFNFERGPDLCLLNWHVAQEVLGCSKFSIFTETNLMMDRETGRPRGFAFVTMSSAEEAQKAIAALNGSHLDGRALTVNVSKPREQRPSGGGSGRGCGGGGGRREGY
jgi:hypothetical protein